IKETFHEEVKMLLLKTIDKVVEKRELSNLNKIWNIQVITPMKNTHLGTKALNNILQARLNTIEGKQMYIKDALLKEYDKVIHLKNQTMKYLPKKTYDNLRESGCSIKEAFEKASETRIYNGFIGLVYNLEKEEEFFTVRYYENNKDDFIVFYNLDDYGSILDLAYALTIHKTQGGEFDYVFIPIVNAFYVMLNNKLMYTALTRARQKAFVIGQPYAFKRACTNVDVTLRFTWLKDFE
ncbi:MAG TPA: hypothetical protein ENO30_05515, partial [Thermodesulfobium narugense]|nr:hypothetical protein [Thermodesulfobium narugense]